jgi:hypothetical protein
MMKLFAGGAVAAFTAPTLLNAVFVYSRTNPSHAAIHSEHSAANDPRNAIR